MTKERMSPDIFSRADRRKASRIDMPHYLSHWNKDGQFLQPETATDNLLALTLLTQSVRSGRPPSQKFLIAALGANEIKPREAPLWTVCAWLQRLGPTSALNGDERLVEDFGNALEILEDCPVNPYTTPLKLSCEVGAARAVHAEGRRHSEAAVRSIDELLERATDPSEVLKLKTLKFSLEIEDIKRTHVAGSVDDVPERQKEAQAICRPHDSAFIENAGSLHILGQVNETAHFLHLGLKHDVMLGTPLGVLSMYNGGIMQCDNSRTHHGLRGNRSRNRNIDMEFHAMTMSGPEHVYLQMKVNHGPENAPPELSEITFAPGKKFVTASYVNMRSRYLRLVDDDRRLSMVINPERRIDDLFDLITQNRASIEPES